MRLKGDWLKLYNSATKRGWVLVRHSKNNHVVLLWPVTGRKITLSNSADFRAIRNAEKQLKRIEEGLAG